VTTLVCRILTAIHAINVLSVSCGQDCFHWKGIAGNVLANLRNIFTNIVGDLKCFFIRNRSLQI